ncbi:MAG: roadblock/LC7 domain-containing protein [Acidobacteriota bacterium]
MATAQETLGQISDVGGYVGSCIVDSESGMMLAADGGGPVNLELAAAGNTEVVRAKRATMRSLDLDDRIDDILITLDKQYHLIRPVTNNDALFIYVVIDKKANLAMARHALAGAEKDLVI